MSDEVEIARIERGYGKFLVVKIATWKDSNYVDVREYYTEKESDELRPTKKGIRFSYDLVEEIQDALAKVKEHVEGAS
ncbi:MAG: transcriptional coactivator p15/PC4 family protein [Candidatus Eremiobacteraeota bacterium]|nr:transcriptional coactivator p15/PC4 family protein [Candidatus Eremiobacteraeota bacterium]